MTECQRCDAKAHNAFLCGRCETHLHRLLADLPWWLERLTETALGQTRMADNGGRRSARRRDLDGEAELAACIELLPHGEEDLDKARKAREKAALAHALATGGINARASELLAEIADSLGYWMRVLCEHRGIIPPQLGVSPTLGGMRARWLADNVKAIAASEDAGDVAMDIENHMEDLLRVINRPMRWWALGDCPGWIDKAPDREEGPCGSALRVPENTTEVRCRKCGTTHNVQLLLLARKHEAEGTPKTRRELVRYNRELPLEFQVPPRTLRQWLNTGLLQACADNDGDPLYSWMDVRLLMLDTKHATKAVRHESAG